MPTLFSPFSAITGGVLIGLAACVLYAGIGRIAGISGIVNTAIAERDGRLWRVLFLGALMLGAAAWMWSVDPPGAAGPAVRRPWVLLAGLLVGVGTALGNGCTSGHGICGLARLSRRSLVAVLVFMGCAMATVYVLRHVPGGAA